MKVAILTNMMDFNPGYSLTGIIRDQTKMLKRHGDEVHLFVNSHFNKKDMQLFEHCKVHQEIPFSHLVDYERSADISEYHQDTIKETTEVLCKQLKDYDVVFTHDFMFVGWFLPYGMACLATSKVLPKLKWFHWVHSVPSVFRDWWDMNTMRPNHKMVFPNAADHIRVAEQYRGTVNDVLIIPHIKDVRTWFDFHPDTCRLIDMMPSILSSRIMQVLPAGSDRLSAKGIDKVIKIFAAIKASGNSVCLLIANQWASGRVRKECLGPYEDLARTVGLESGKDFAFTSDLHEDWANGLPQHMIRELFLCSNLFVFPTREESFGLVVPEASLSGVMTVLNKSLESQKSISGHQSMYIDFGSFTHNFEIKKEGAYFRDVAYIILSRLMQNEALRQRTFFKNQNNMDYLYHNFYGPLMRESVTWGA